MYFTINCTTNCKITVIQYADFTEVGNKTTSRNLGLEGESILSCRRAEMSGTQLVYYKTVLCKTRLVYLILHHVIVWKTPHFTVFLANTGIKRCYKHLAIHKEIN